MNRLRLAIVTVALCVTYAGAAQAAQPLNGLSADGTLEAAEPPIRVGSLSADGMNRVFVLSEDGTRVLVHSVGGQLLDDWGTVMPPPRFGPVRIASSSGGEVYVLGEGRIRRYTSEGVFIETLGDPGDGGEVAFNGQPLEMTATARDELLVSTGRREYLLDRDGNLLFSRPSIFASALAVDPRGVSWAVTLFGLVGRATAGQFLGRIPYGTRAGAGHVENDADLAIGPAGELLTIDSSLQVFGTDGQVRLSCRVAQSSAPPAMAVGADGSVFVAGSDEKVRAYRPSSGGGVCARAPFRVSRFSVRAAGHRAVDVSVRIKPRRRGARRERYGLSLRVVKEGRVPCADGPSSSTDACFGIAGVEDHDLILKRGRLTTRQRIRLDSRGRHRFNLVADAVTSRARVVTRMVRADVG